MRVGSPGFLTRLWMRLSPVSVYDAATEDAARRRQAAIINEARTSRARLGKLAADYRKEDRSLRERGEVPAVHRPRKR